MLQVGERVQSRQEARDYIPARQIGGAGSTSTAAAGPIAVRVFVGDRELTDIVRVELDQRTAAENDYYAYAGG